MKFEQYYYFTNVGTCAPEGYEYVQSLLSFSKENTKTEPADRNFVVAELSLTRRVTRSGSLPLRRHTRTERPRPCHLMRPPPLLLTRSMPPVPAPASETTTWTLQPAAACLTCQLLLSV